VVEGHLARRYVRGQEGGAAVVGLPRGDVRERQAREREVVGGGRTREWVRLLRTDRPVAVTASQGLVGEPEEFRGGSVVRHAERLASRRHADGSDDVGDAVLVGPDARLAGALALREQQVRIERGRRGGGGLLRRFRRLGRLGVRGRVGRRGEERERRDEGDDRGERDRD